MTDPAVALGLAFVLAKIAVVLTGVLGTVILMVWLERRVAAFIQDRLGPNRVGPEGLLQPLADGIKLLTKEEVMPPHTDRPLYLLAPLIFLTPALITFAVIPFGDMVHLFGQEIPLIITDVNIGILYIFAVASLGVYGIVLAGWSSNNKYSLLGGLRSVAQMISYELALSLSVMGVLMLTGSLSLVEVVQDQVGLQWNVFRQPLGFLIFLVAMFAETNRLPFDLPEAEAELVAGYHTEYSSMKFGLFYLTEYINMIMVSALMVTLFLGGWQIPFLARLGIPEPLEAALGVLAFALKVGFFLFLFIWVRWTLPRFRYDRLMALGWKVFVPLGLINVALTGIGIVVFG